jgi:hypothetical protein
MLNEIMKNQSACNYRRPCKKRQRQGAQGTRREAYFGVLHNNEGRSATQHMDFLRGRHVE